MFEVKTSRILKVSEILRGDPCYTYSRRLAERFTGEIEVTVELALSQADDWDWYWAASHLLTVDGYREFAKAVDKNYEASEAELEPLQVANRAAHNRAREEYNRVLNDYEKDAYGWTTDAAYRAASKIYSEVVEVTDAALDAARKITQSRMNKVAAETFATLYIGEEGTEERTGNDRYYADDYEGEDY